MHNFWLGTAAVLLILAVLILPWVPGGFFVWMIMNPASIAITFIAIFQIVFLIVGIIAIFAAFA